MNTAQVVLHTHFKFGCNVSMMLPFYLYICYIFLLLISVATCCGLYPRGTSLNCSCIHPRCSYWYGLGDLPRRYVSFYTFLGSILFLCFMMLSMISFRFLLPVSFHCEGGFQGMHIDIFVYPFPFCCHDQTCCCSYQQTVDMSRFLVHRDCMSCFLLLLSLLLPIISLQLLLLDSSLISLSLILFDSFSSPDLSTGSPKLLDVSAASCCSQ